MPLDKTERHLRYWRHNLRLTIVLLFVWFFVTYVAAFYARDLNQFTLFGFPLGFYMGAQGALIVYVAIVGYYSYRMGKLDREYGVSEKDD